MGRGKVKSVRIVRVANLHFLCGSKQFWGMCDCVWGEGKFKQFWGI
jgi:hypothetical protein